MNRPVSLHIAVLYWICRRTAARTFGPQVFGRFQSGNLDARSCIRMLTQHLGKHMVAWRNSEVNTTLSYDPLERGGWSALCMRRSARTLRETFARSAAMLAVSFCTHNLPGLWVR